MSDAPGFAAPTDDLIRMLPLVDCELRADEEGRTLTGYAAVFDVRTEINSWEGNFLELLKPGAFKRSLRNNGDQIKVLFNHGFDPQIGDKPLGKPNVLREDAKGLYVEVPLSRTSYNDDLIALIEDGAIDGMSFRFSVPKGGDSWEYPKGKLPVRTITEAKLSRELGPVTFPAYKATTAGIRSREEFTLWQQLPEEKRVALFEILGTPLVSPAEGTDTDESANDTPGSDSERAGATTPTGPTSDARERELILLGVLS